MAKSRDPEYHRAVSHHIARVLDEVGLNKLVVKRRRDARLYSEHMQNVYFRISGKNILMYYFGSQTEGATTPGMVSDLDMLGCSYEFNVIEDWMDWQQGKINLLMLLEDTPPGYCRLQLLRDDLPLAREDLPHFTYEDSGRVIMKNTIIHTITGLMGNDRSGPAATERGGPGVVDIDYVPALPCSAWPVQAAEFTKRRRCYGWPSQRLLEEAVSHDVFLVPVGHKMSQTEPLEWRISTSLAERCLMFSLTIVHIKCYVVLKILAKTFIEPQIQKCISSYHCKTALLHCTETTESDFWREDNLLQCITRCLKILRNWVADLFCPQFVISEENLFAGKVTIHNREYLLAILTELIRSDGRALLQVQMDDIGHKLQTRLNTKPERSPEAMTSVMLIGQVEHLRHDTIDDTIKNYILYEEEHPPPVVLRSVLQILSTLQEQVEQTDKHGRQAIQTSILFLSCWLGSLLASFSLSSNMKIPRQAIQLMSTAAKYDVASLLKLASAFYCSGQYSKADTILQTVEDRFKSNEMLVICKCYNMLTMVPLEFCRMIYALKGKERRYKLFAHCVRFSRLEIHCTPSALRHEMYRSVGDDIHLRDPDEDNWMVMACIDSLPFLYFMQYLTYKQLGQHDLKRCSLRNLDQCVREDHDFRHLETAWNLLGQCLEDDQDSHAAMVCYRISLEIRSRNNAANWHVAILWYKLMKQRDLLPVVTEDQTKK